MDIGSVVDEYIDSADLERFRKAYEDQLNRGVPSAMTVFNYAHALIKSTKEDVRIGIFLLEGLLKRDTEDIPKRDYVYYLAIALTRIKDYDRALAYIDTLLAAESDNRQALDLKDLIQKRMKRDGLLGLAVLGLGGGVAFGGWNHRCRCHVSQALKLTQSDFLFETVFPMYSCMLYNSK